jgi:hypothetical protein
VIYAVKLHQSASTGMMMVAIHLSLTNRTMKMTNNYAAKPWKGAQLKLLEMTDNSVFIPF